MVVNGRPLKRAKSRVAVGPLDLDAIAAAGDVGRPFRESVRAFLSRHARIMPLPSILSPPAAATPPHLLTWRAAFRISGAAGDGVELSVVDEDVMRSRSVYCDQCRVVGWSGHPVCGKRYHFIIRNESRDLSSSRQTCCVHCGTPLPPSESRCVVCKFETEGEELEDWGVQLDDPSHLLHAVVHANGYGHLLRVNGREGGSTRLTGRDIMSFWDRLCKLLHVRKVTVMDISKKYGMEYRLLHAVTAGHPWYGEWGYRFGAGSYAITADSYHKAVEALAGVPLSLRSAHSRSPRSGLQDTIALYRSLSDNLLTTVRDLFRYIICLLHERTNGDSKHSAKTLRGQNADMNTSIYNNNNNNNNNINSMLCMWAREDVERVENAMIKVLRAVGESKWVGLRALKGATARAAESLELLDYCLKGLGGKATSDGLIVAVRCNAETSTIEYRLEEATEQILSDGGGSSKPSTEHLIRDLKFLYDALLNPSTMHQYKPQTTRTDSLNASTKILDCKQFIKCYNGPTSNPLPVNPFVLHVWCQAELIDHTKDYTKPPPELLVLSTSATISDLKLDATKAFQDTYLVFQGFQAEQIITRANVGDTALVKHVVNPNEVVRVRGRCIGDYHYRLSQFRMERGVENWIVDCVCGARDDDGERMMACDTCGVWQHTRCNRISDLDEVPAQFICGKCGAKGGATKRQEKGGLSNNGLEQYKDEMKKTSIDGNLYEKTGRRRECI